MDDVGQHCLALVGAQEAGRLFPRQLVPVIGHGYVVWRAGLMLSGMPLGCPKTASTQLGRVGQTTIEGGEVTSGHRMLPSWLQPLGRAGFIANSRQKLPRETMGLRVHLLQCPSLSFDDKLMAPIGSELLPHGASALPEPIPILQLLSDCFFGVSNKLSLSQLGLVLGSSLSLGRQEGCVHLSSCLCSSS